MSPKAKPKKTSQKRKVSPGKKSRSHQQTEPATKALEGEVLAPLTALKKRGPEKGLSAQEISMGVILPESEDGDPSEQWLQMYGRGENSKENTDISNDTAQMPTFRAGAISPSDPLRRYLEEVARYQLLSPEEEYELATRMFTQGDVNAAKLLVQANLRLVVKIAFEYRSIYNNPLDLIQEGNIGLMKAVSKYDPSKGARLGYYSSWWIRSYILKYILDNFRLVKIGTTQAQKKLFYHLMREKQKLEAQGIQAGPKLLADKLDVKESEVEEMSLRLSGGGAEASLDSPLKSGGTEGEKSTSFKDLLESQETSADEILAHQEALQILQDRLPHFAKTLDDKERKVLENRMISEDPKTLQEIADLYGLTRERVRQIENNVIHKLKIYLRDLLSDSPNR